MKFNYLYHFITAMLKSQNLVGTIFYWSSSQYVQTWNRERFYISFFKVKQNDAIQNRCDLEQKIV